MFKAIVDAYKIWSDNKHLKQEDKEKAFGFVRIALQETKIYVIKLQSGEKENKEHEVLLSNLWSEASQFARKIDPDLAQRLHKKANYWLNPDNYSIEYAFQEGIRLDRIDADITEALEYLP